MRPLRLLLTIVLAVAFAAPTYAGPTTNLKEYQGDKKLTKEQQARFQKLLDDGVANFEQGQYAKAEENFKEILTFAPEKNLAYFNLGLTKYKQGDYQAAINYFDTVVKKRSYYVGAAFYYKAICQLNLGQKEEALKTAKRFTPARFFYKPSQNLIKSIQNGTDEYLDNAKAAYADENYELCLLELEESVLTDTASGKEVLNQCKAGIAKEDSVTSEVVVEKLPNRKRLWVDAKYMHTDNAYQENSFQFDRYLYEVEVGGEYIWANTVDVGIGASYQVSDAIDLPNFKDELLNVYVPLYYRVNNHRWNGQIFYNHDKYNGDDAWSQSGAFANYFYTTGDNVLGLVAAASQRNSLTTAFDYKSGPFSSARALYTRYINAWTLSAYLGADENRAGAQPVGTGLLPYGNKAVRAGASIAYDFNELVSRLTLKGSTAQKDYLDVVSVNGTDREDTQKVISVTYLHKFNKNVRAWLEHAHTQNDSNYDNAEVINKNYTENLTTLGLSLTAF
ncbi:MAG: Anaphase-promoting complex, cyclosome, subunit 3 [Pseudobdellovibrio sp.]|jgi:tetratricopeptide (TPR) repeat protein|nr:Anaphase-promoting complex, cyclosome, subunit 3 [Pseudobdellovibrio sp.]